MRNSIVLKWFMLTSLLLFMVFLLIGIAQGYVFKKYYITQKLKTLQTFMDNYLDLSTEKGVETTSLQLYDKEHIWITKLDEYGQICDVGHYYITVKPRDSDDVPLMIPMYPFESVYHLVLHIGDEVVIDVINVDDKIIPYIIQTKRFGLLNSTIANKLHGSYDNEYYDIKTSLYTGTITDIVITNQSEIIPFPYSEQLFIEQIKDFQFDLLSNTIEDFQEIKELSVEENFIEYKILVKPILEDGRKKYIFAMTSLQPVDEAMNVMQSFLPYFLGFAFLCLITLAFIFSKLITKPLISINRITSKIANMDFTERLPVKSNDEIGELSQNINYLSSQIENNIERLKCELGKEKKLEVTRKKFIEGVSHELKTPLAVMDSCLSIIRDGIAKEKSEHYFQAIENEINRMNTLITNMLDLAKFSSGTYKPKMYPFEINVLIEEVCKSLDEQIKEKLIALKMEIYPQSIIGHKVLIGRVITNFLSNAIRHTKNGGTIILSINCYNQLIEISVENEGEHLSEENILKIWNQFYSIKSPSSKNGTGLGLSLSKEILELHYATYGVENTSIGVRFYFSLPVANPQQL